MIQGKSHMNRTVLVGSHKHVRVDIFGVDFRDIVPHSELGMGDVVRVLGEHEHVNMIAGGNYCEPLVTRRSQLGTVFCAPVCR